MQIDIHLGGRWLPCANITLRDPQRPSPYGGVTLAYDAAYAKQHLQARDIRALSVRMPVDFGVRALPTWPAFLIDLLPQGAARRRLERSATPLSDWDLLTLGASNPVGNLRIGSTAAESTKAKAAGYPGFDAHPGFELDEMIGRGSAFIDHAEEVGAMVAGATDTQGEAPKFWVVQDASGRWHPDDGTLGHIARRFALLKFPVPEAGPRAADILRHEAVYQRVARAFGLRVTAELPEFVDGALLIPRFDRRVGAAGEIRLGVESVYSMAGVLDSARGTLRHHEVLIELRRCASDFETEAIEYCKRDVLNLALGNRDNHGRNTALLKDVDGSVRLAPLYDFGPSYLDARAVARVIRWDAESQGRIDWTVALANLEIRFEDAGLPPPRLDRIAAALREIGGQLTELPQILRESGADGALIDACRGNAEALIGPLSRVKAP